MVEFLVLISFHGITKNPTKFVFWKKEVEFIGFQIREDGFAPCAATVEAIGIMVIWEISQYFVKPLFLCQKAHLQKILSLTSKSHCKVS